MAHAHPGHEGPCPNCGHALTAEDRFCSRCGQANHSLKIPIGHLLYETVEGIFHFDNKFFRTLWRSITRPGLIIHDFLEGRRARYVPPIRLYIFVSVIFFFLLNKTIHSDDGPPSITFSNNQKQANGITYSSRPDTLKSEKADQGLNQGTEISLGENVVTLNGIINYTPQNLTAAFQMNRVERMGQRGIELRGIAPTQLEALPYRKRIGLFMPALRDTLLHWPDTTVFLGWKPTPADTARDLHFTAWKANVDSATIPMFRKALTTKDEDTLLPMYRDGKSYLYYQPRFMGVPSDSASMASYVHLKKRKDIEALFAQWGRHPDFWERLFFTRTVYFYKMLRDNSGADFFESVVLPLAMKYISFSVFLLMPLAGFLLLMFFFKQRRYYYEHLIFSIYSHAFAFLIFSIGLGLELIFEHTALENTASTVSNVLAISVFIYFILSLKRVYSQGWIRTLLKSFVVMGLYSFCLLLLAGAMFVLSLATF